MLNQLKDFLATIRDHERRLRNLESFNQLQKAIFKDATTNRILIDGINGALKISIAGNDVLTADSAHLLFSTDFGALVESHYRLTDTSHYTNSTDWVYHGPTNAVTGNPDPIRILVNSADYKNIQFYFEANMSGQGDAICEAQLYNYTNSAAVSGSLIDSVSGSIPVRVRSGAFSLAAGSKEYCIQYKRVGGTSSDYPNLEEGHLVARIAL